MARILVIDDEPAIRSMARRALTEFGHSVLEAADGEEGLRAVDEHEPDLVLCDILMPNLDGIETIIRLRIDHRTLPVIAMSGSGARAGLSYLSAAEKLGANASLRKPFRTDELRDLVTQLLTDTVVDPVSPTQAYDDI